MEIKDKKLYQILQMDDPCPTYDCRECDYYLEDNRCAENAALTNYLADNGVVVPTRCENCQYFIEFETMINNDWYAKYDIYLAKSMGFDGLCDNIDKWKCLDQYCSEGVDKNEMD